MSTHATLPAAEAFRHLCINNKIAVIDVRSAGEYNKAHFGNTLNMPILSDAHRHDVGLTYKTEGSGPAKALGHQLVSGAYKALMIQQWCEAIKSQSESSLIFCWRGGLRSRLAQDWIYENGCEAIRVDSGYKGLRQEALKQIETPGSFIILSGMTGAGKTRLLHKLRNFVDLEALANHRGSAFGSHFDAGQPQQATFENKLAQSLYQTTRNYILEDESPNIGRCHVPDRFYARMATAPMVIIETPAQQRALAIYQEYIQIPLANGIPLPTLECCFAKNIERIRNKLGGLECDNIKKLLTKSFALNALTDDGIAAHLDWIERLLTLYYDNRYLYSLSLKSRKTLFKGSWEDCLNFLTSIDNE